MVSIPLVSVITATYNSQKFIEHTINSVLSQTYTNWELIIVDDASEDNTSTIVKIYSHYPNIRFFENKVNKGPAYTRNRAVDIAQGDYIAFLDGDDLWKPEKLSRQISFMLENDLDISYSSYDLIDETGVSLKKRVNGLPFLSFTKLLKCNYIGNLTGIYNCKSLGKIYSPNLEKRQDWGMWLNALKMSKINAMGVNESLAYYRIRKDSISSNKRGLLKHNYLVYRKGLEFSALKSMLYLVAFLWEYFFIKSKQTVTL